MTVGRFAEEQQDALQQITEDGEVSLYETRTATPIAGQEWRSSGVNISSKDVNAVWLNYREDQIDGELVKKTDQKVLIAALDLIPVEPNANTDFLTRVDGSRWKVKGANTLQPNEDRILETLQVRKINR